MPEFPGLKSGALVQYPVRRVQEPIGVDIAFWGGGSQTYRRKKAEARVWTMKYAGLAEDEAAELIRFCEFHIESGEPFSFRDPVTNEMQHGCVVDAASMKASALGVNAYEFEVAISQVGE